MRTLLKLEELAQTALALYALSFYNLGLSAWIWAILFFVPDVGMLGYLANPKIGAFTYNLFHHKGIALVLLATGYFLSLEIVLSIGLLLFAHASFDRIFGYGLKYETSFKDTHLGSL
jgi:hypothetical protein